MPIIGLLEFSASFWNAMFSSKFSLTPNPVGLIAIEGTTVVKLHDIVLFPQRTCIAKVTPVIICITKENPNNE